MARRDGSPFPPTVLLVEAGQDDRVMYAEYLRIAEFHAVEIDDTADALALARNADVVVTGIQVPGPFDGIELVRRLRADGATKDKPIIVLTACTFEPDQQRAYAAGCDIFVPKPCFPDALVTEIRRAMESRSLPRPQAVRKRGTTRTGNKHIA